jgi:hypothetical protein
MANPATDSEEAGFAPIQAGSIHDRLARWCDRDPLEREAAVLQSLAACREILHRHSDPARPRIQVSVPAEDLAVLVCAVQTGLCPTSRCDN